MVVECRFGISEAGLLGPDHRHLPQVPDPLGPESHNTTTATKWGRSSVGAGGRGRPGPVRPTLVLRMDLPFRKRRGLEWRTCRGPRGEVSPGP